MVSKPIDFRIWAENAAPIDISPPDNVQVDGGYLKNQKPERPEFNQILNELTQFRAHVNEHGIPAWDTLTTYPIVASVYHSGVNYTSLVAANQGIEPGTDPTKWRDAKEFSVIQASVFYLDTGTAAAYNINALSGFGIVNVLFDGFEVNYRAANTNALGPTITVNELPSKPITTEAGVALPAGKIEAGRNIRLRFNASGDRFEFSALGLDPITGVWVPEFGGSGGDPTIGYTTQSGKFTKLGNMVHINGFLQINGGGASGGSGDVTIKNLPFTSANITESHGLSIARKTNWNVTGPDFLALDPNSTQILLLVDLNTGAFEINTTTLTANTAIQFSGWYQTDA